MYGYPGYQWKVVPAGMFGPCLTLRQELSTVGGTCVDLMVR